MYITSGSYSPFYYSGPYHKNNTAYALLNWYSDYSWTSGSTGFYIFKGWYDVSNWSIVDADNTPKFRRIEDACFDGRYWYALTLDGDGGTQNLRLQKFDTETETWVMKDISVKSASSFPQYSASSLGQAGMDIDSNGKLYVWYNYYSSKGYHRIRWGYSTNSGSTWTVDQTISTGVGSRVPEFGYNVHTHGTNIYFWYLWDDGTSTMEDIQRCMVYNGTGWSSESTITPDSSATFCRGRSLVWSSSGSDLVTMIFRPYFQADAYSADTTTGSQPNWGNVLLITSWATHSNNQWPQSLWDNKPIFFHAYYNYDNNPPLDGVYYCKRTSYSAWGSPTKHDYTAKYPNGISQSNPDNNLDMVYMWIAYPNSFITYGNWYDEQPVRPGGSYYFMY